MGFVRELPELLLGAAVGCTAVLGYGSMIAAMALAGGPDLSASPLRAPSTRSGLPLALAADAELVAAATPEVRIGTALAGLASVTCSLFAFLPPRWYRERVETRASLEPASA